VIAFITCPDTECGQIAEVVDRYLIPDSTGTHVAHIETRCLLGHHLTYLP
jgi:hypothetical protein